MTSTVTDPVATTLADWERQLVALGDGGDTPQTYNAQAEYARRHSWLMGHIRQVHECQRALGELLPEIAKLTRWRDDLETVRKVICDEYLALPSPIRRDDDRTAEAGLRLSIRVCDVGARVLEDLGSTVEGLPLGELLRKRGYASLPEHFPGLVQVERTLADLVARRDDAQTRLDITLAESL